jgi:hypothetical protein
MPDTPLRPDELDTYGTDVQTDAEAPDPKTPDARPGVLIGLALLVVFVIALVAALAFALGS